MNGFPVGLLLHCALAFALFCGCSAEAAPCHKVGDTVIVAGIIHMQTQPANEQIGRTKPWVYPVVTLQRSLCFKSVSWGDIPVGAVVSVMIAGTERKFSEGQHVVLRGQLAPRNDESQPPEPYMLVISDMPPDAPEGDEIVIHGESDKVAADCANQVRKMSASLGATIIKTVVTVNPRWGTIWRADVSHPLPDGYPPMLWREVCTGKFFVSRPLEMFDPSKSIPRLQ
jgi:hypothetical protein